MLPDFDSLAPLERFDPQAFCSDDRAEQAVCDFVLMLALVFNDFKDLLWALTQLEANKPDLTQITTQRGQYGGMQFHITKLLHALIFDLSELIQKNEDAINHPLFKKTLDAMRGQTKARWNDVVRIARGQVTNDERALSKVSELVRHNISAHYYQPRFLSAGYRKHFGLKLDPAYQNGFISRGDSLRTSRFYFADAGVSGCFATLTEGQLDDLRKTMADFADAINKALYDLVQNFILVRGFRISLWSA